MNPYGADPDDVEVKYEEQGFHENRHTLSTGRQALGISINYVPGWKPPHALREIYQNWKDGIIEAFGLQQKNFEVTVKGFDAKEIYTTEARHPETRNLLGFIRFQGGVLEFTNFRARLPRRALDLGVSTKRENEELAGTHGEGFKVAALVMVRRGYRVRYEASSYYWNFKLSGLNQNHLYCHLGPMAEEKLKTLKEVETTRLNKGSPRKLTSNIWEDVTVRIGRFYSRGEPISKTDFLRWINVSLDLDNPAKIIQTPYGSLILDDRFKARIYLKGLLLEGKTSSRDFKFGYNFLKGDVNRDRQKLTNSKDEADMLTKIWAMAIETDGQEVLDQYISMLREDNWADTTLAQDYISLTLAKSIWHRLITKDSAKKIFYHDSTNCDRDVELIKWSLKKEPVQLPKSIWDAVRRHKLVRTPQEQRYHLLYNAPESTKEETTYSISVRRALMASLALDSRTKKLKMIFKSGAKAELDLLLDGTKLLIHERWLNFDASHQEAPCWLSRLAASKKKSIDTFSCDHVIADLYDLVLAEVTKSPRDQTGDEIEKDSFLRLKVSENLRQMPRKVNVMHGKKAGELVVSWTDMESDMAAKMHGFSVECRVTMHQESTCDQKRHELLGPAIPADSLENAQLKSPTQSSPQFSTCACPEQVVPQKDSKAVFQSLNHTETYFPLVSRIDSQAFYGLPPSGLQPKTPEVELLITYAPRNHSTPRPIFNPRRSNYEPPKFEDENGNIYDADSDDENGMNLDSPVARPSSQSSMNNDENETIIVDDPTRAEPTTSSTPAIVNNSSSATKFQNSDLLKKIQKAEDEVKNLRKNLDSSQASLAKMEEELGQRNLEVEQFQTKISQDAEAGAIKDNKIQEHAAIIESLRTALAHEKSNVEAAISKFLQRGTYMQMINQQLQSANATIQDLNAQLGVKDRDLQAAVLRSANLAAEELAAGKRDAEVTLQRLQNKIENLLEENQTLSERLQEAERDLSEQRRIFTRQEERLRSSRAGFKRAWSSDSRGVRDISAGDVKRPRNSSMAVPDESIDLTDDN